MLYFPIFSFIWPDWLPLIGGTSFHFFSAIFNVADSSIFIGVMILLIWQKKFFPEPDIKKEGELDQQPERESTEPQLQDTVEGAEEEPITPEQPKT